MARIAVDAMGGDYAPHEIVRGAIDVAAAHTDVEKIFLVGEQAAIEAELNAAGDWPRDRLELVNATEVVGMDESPATAVRRKKDSSINRAVDLVKSGAAQAVFSAGNTGAAVASTTLKLRMLEGVDRPAIATVVPSPHSPFVLLDAGATPDCTPRMLVQFAAMGSIYAQEVLGIERARVGLMSIGEEDAKGNETTKEAFRLLEKTHLNFIGNVESHDTFEGEVDVVICDGFVGNVVLKTAESAAKAVTTWIKNEVKRRWLYQLGALIMKGAFENIRELADPAAYGGAPLLGVNGFCVIGHGSSRAKAARNGIRFAVQSVTHQVTPRLLAEVARVNEAVAT